MSQWSFVILAYAVVACAIGGLIAWAWRSMRAAEARAEAVKRRS